RPWTRLAGPLAALAALLGGEGLAGAGRAARLRLAEEREIARLQRTVGGGRQRGALGTRLRGLGRGVVLGAANLVFPRPNGAVPPLGAIRKVLVVRLDERVGNQLLTSPLLRALKLGIPNASLHLLAPKQGRLVACRHVDRLVLWQKREAFRKPWRLVALLRALRRERYDLVVEAGHWQAFSLTSALVARIVGRRGAIVGHDRGDAARFFSHPVPHDPANGVEVPAKLELLAPLGIPARGLEPETELGSDPAPAEALLRSVGLDGREFAVLNPGARLADRRSPPAFYATVARGLAARGVEVLVVWGPGEEVLAKAIAEGGGATLAPPTDLALLAGLMRKARLVVSNNSGPMHLGVAVGAPTVGVFFSGDSARWGHPLAAFAAVEARGEADAAAVVSACERLLQAGTALRAVPPSTLTRP
ncbi:MAG TPA: glycosyltransferase family 9 protein, partial [Anaeromyxobacteraceae bacterium]|nr:glycosyltransferase family 9 protein [Anaeromyxobacteraceae bacterium]